MSNTLVKSREELERYRAKGYTSNIQDVADFLDMKETKTRELVKGMPRIDISEPLYNELKNSTDLKAYRAFYHLGDVFTRLLRTEDSRHRIRVFYGDMRRVISNINTQGEEVEFSKEYVIENLPLFFFLMQASKSLNDIVIEDLGYSFLCLGSDNEMLFTNDEDDLKSYEEITDKSTLKKYDRMIKRDFYIKFQVGKRKKLYFQSIRRHKIEGLQGRIVNLIRNYEESQHH